MFILFRGPGLSSELSESITMTDLFRRRSGGLLYKDGQLGSGELSEFLSALLGFSRVDTGERDKHGLSLDSDEVSWIDGDARGEQLLCIIESVAFLKNSLSLPLRRLFHISPLFFFPICFTQVRHLNENPLTPPTLLNLFIAPHCGHWSLLLTILKKALQFSFSRKKTLLLNWVFFSNFRLVRRSFHQASTSLCLVTLHL